MMMRSRNPKFGPASLAPYGRNHPQFQQYADEYAEFYGEQMPDDEVSQALKDDDGERYRAIQNDQGDDAQILHESFTGGQPMEVPTFDPQRVAEELFRQRMGRPPVGGEDHVMIEELMRVIMQMPNFNEEKL